VPVRVVVRGDRDACTAKVLAPRRTLRRCRSPCCRCLDVRLRASRSRGLARAWVATGWIVVWWRVRRDRTGVFWRPCGR